SVHQIDAKMSCGPVDAAVVGRCDHPVQRGLAPGLRGDPGIGLVLDGPARPVVSCSAPTGSRRLVDHRAEIAQLVEHATENRGVASSNLALGTTLRWADLRRKWLSW